MMAYSASRLDRRTLLTGLVVGPLAVGFFNDSLFAGRNLAFACALLPLLIGVPGLTLLRYTQREYSKALAGPYNGLSLTQQPGGN